MNEVAVANNVELWRLLRAKVPQGWSCSLEYAESLNWAIAIAEKQVTDGSRIRMPVYVHRYVDGERVRTLEEWRAIVPEMGKALADAIENYQEEAADETK